MDRKLIEQAEALKSAAAAILEQHPNGLTAEKAAEFDRLMGDYEALQLKITQERKADDRKAQLLRATEFLERPEYRTPRAVEGGPADESDDRKMLQRAGWEFKSGVVLAPTSVKHPQTGEYKVEMFTEDVLFGPLPENDPTRAEFYSLTRASFKPEYRKAYERMIRLSSRVPVGLSPVTFMTPAEQKALSEGLDASGGFLVPPDVQAEVLVRLAQFTVFRRNSRVQTTSRDILKWPTVQAASATEGGVAAGGGSIFSSGFVGSWVGETPSQSDKDPAFGEFDVPIRKARVQTRLSNDFVSDSAVNVLAFLAQNGAENMALVEDMAFFVGTGVLQPVGVTVSGALPTATDVEGSTANTISNTIAATGSAPKIIDLAYALPSQYLSGARWYMRRAIEGKVRKLVDAQGRFMWPPLAGSAFAATPSELLGYPVENSEFMPNDGTDTNKVMLFGNLANGYIIGQRAQITSTVLRERYADTDQTGLILWERVGGDVWNGDALRVGAV